MSGPARDRLFVITLLYLLVPNVIFLAGWLRPVWSVPAIAVLAACVVDLLREKGPAAPSLTARQWAFVAAFALFWTTVAGIGELGPQVTDYLKHNLVFHDLVVRPWPVVYGETGPHGALLCYYLAYYLPASLVGKTLGLAWTAPASFLWGLTGVALAFAWIARLARGRGAAVLVVFTLVDGFGWLPGLYPFARNIGLLPGRVEGVWWGAGFTEAIASFGVPPIRLLFECVPRQLLWAPQHTIAVWLVTACLLRTLGEGRPPRQLGLVLASALLWSPFVVIGALPFAVMALRGRMRAAAGWPGVVGGAVIALPIGLYFLSHAPQQYIGFLPALFSGGADWLRYAFFLVTSIGALAFAVGIARTRAGAPASADWRLFVVAAIMLAAATLVYIGRFDDWIMRASGPALTVFRLTVARVAVELWSRRGRLAPRLAFAGLVLMSAERPLKTWALAPFGRLPGQGCNTTIATATLAAASVAHLRGDADWDYAGQYLGSKRSTFARHLMRRPGLGPALTAPR